MKKTSYSSSIVISPSHLVKFLFEMGVVYPIPSLEAVQTSLLNQAENYISYDDLENKSLVGVRVPSLINQDINEFKEWNEKQINEDKQMVQGQITIPRTLYNINILEQILVKLDSWENEETRELKLKLSECFRQKHEERVEGVSYILCYKYKQHNDDGELIIKEEKTSRDGEYFYQDQHITFTIRGKKNYTRHLLYEFKKIDVIKKIMVETITEASGKGKDKEENCQFKLSCVECCKEENISESVLLGGCTRQTIGCFAGLNWKTNDNEDDKCTPHNRHKFKTLLEYCKPITCNICLEQFVEPVNLQDLHCGHTFCGNCISNHMRIGSNEASCPTCRKPIGVIHSATRQDEEIYQSSRLEDNNYLEDVHSDTEKITDQFHNLSSILTGNPLEDVHSDTEKITDQFHNLSSILTGHPLRKIANVEIEIIANHWDSLIISLLTFESSKIIDLVETLSFHKATDVNKYERVLIMLQIFCSYAKMQLVSLEEFHAAFDSFGITIFAAALPHNDMKCEAVFRVLFPSKTLFFKDTLPLQKFCRNMEENILSSLKSPTALKWIKEKLNEDEDIINLENQSFFEKFPLDKVAIKVNYAYPGSCKCIVHVKFPDLSENPGETNALIKIIQTVLKKIEFLTKVGIDKSRETDSTILRLKVDVGFGLFTLRKKKAMDLFLKEFVSNVRKNLITGKEEMRKILQDANEDIPLGPVAIDQVISKLFEKDSIGINIDHIEVEPQSELFVETVRLKNIPLWPLKSRKLSELPNRTRHKMSLLLDNNFPRETCEEFAQNMDVFQQENNNYRDLLDRLNNLLAYRSPFFEILQCYSEKNGTICGLLTSLQSCMQSERIRKELKSRGNDPDLIITHMASEINTWNGEFFEEWKETLSSQMRENATQYENGIAEYEDFRKACSAKTTMKVLKANARDWTALKNIAQEGDQIWMARHKKGTRYAHVGVFIGEGDMIHVSEGESYGCGKIKKDMAESVIGDSKCLIVRPDVNRQQSMSGTPKNRAIACLNVNFLYSVTEGSCEVFANCVTQGIWTSDLATLQGKEHPHVDNTITVWNAMRNSNLRKNQKKDMLEKLATCLLKKGFTDQNIVQHVRAQLSPSLQQSASDSHENPENIRVSENLEPIPGTSSQDDENLLNFERSTSPISHQEVTIRGGNDENDTNMSNGKGLEQFLADIGLSQLQDVFLQQEVNLDMLINLTNDDLKDVGISKFGQRKKILDAARKIKGETILLPTSSPLTTIQPEIMSRQEIPRLSFLGGSRPHAENEDYDCK